MKLLITLFVSIFSLSAFADNNVEQTKELLKLLMDNSSKITVVDQDFKTKKNNLSEVISDTLSVSALTKNEGQYKVFIHMNSKCEKDTPKGLQGVRIMKCELNIIDGDYNQNKDGFAGPDSVRTTSFEFKTMESTHANPNAKKQIQGNTVTVSRLD